MNEEESHRQKRESPPACPAHLAGQPGAAFPFALAISARKSRTASASYFLASLLDQPAIRARATASSMASLGRAEGGRGAPEAVCGMDGPKKKQAWQDLKADVLDRVLIPPLVPIPSLQDHLPFKKKLGAGIVLKTGGSPLPTQGVPSTPTKGEGGGVNFGVKFVIVIYFALSQIYSSSKHKHKHRDAFMFKYQHQ